MAMALPKYEGKIFLQLVCGNAIAEIGEEKKNLWQCIAEIGEEKKNSGYQNLGRN